MRVLVIGASTKQHRTSYEALHMLKEADHEVFAIGRSLGTVADVIIEEGMPEIKDVDTVTLYVNPKILPSYVDYITKLKPRRIIFNPGTEDSKLATFRLLAGCHPVVEIRISFSPLSQDA